MQLASLERSLGWLRRRGQSRPQWSSSPGHYLHGYGGGPLGSNFLVRVTDVDVFLALWGALGAVCAALVMAAMFALSLVSSSSSSTLVVVGEVVVTPKATP
eukprot:851082-Prorocentrum_minimum.AAC.1